MKNRKPPYRWRRWRSRSEKRRLWDWAQINAYTIKQAPRLVENIFKKCPLFVKLRQLGPSVSPYTEWQVPLSLDDQVNP